MEVWRVAGGVNDREGTMEKEAKEVAKRGEKKMGKDMILIFFLNFSLRFLDTQCLESTLIYRG
jgi:hypothetical protein